MLQFGQVYYWLGKQKEGQDEFKKLLAKHQRKVEILCSLANVLRDLGAAAEARTLMEEAYGKVAGQEGAARHRPVPRHHIHRPGRQDPLVGTLRRQRRSCPGPAGRIAGCPGGNPGQRRRGGGRISASGGDLRTATAGSRRVEQRRAGLSGPLRGQRRPPGPRARHPVAGQGRAASVPRIRWSWPTRRVSCCERRFKTWRAPGSIFASCKCPRISPP